MALALNSARANHASLMWFCVRARLNAGREDMVATCGVATDGPYVYGANKGAII